MDYLHPRNTLMFGEYNVVQEMGAFFIRTRQMYSFLPWWLALNGGHSDKGIINKGSEECDKSFQRLSQGKGLLYIGHDNRSLI